jgi:hypothetical protein
MTDHNAVLTSRLEDACVKLNAAGDCGPLDLATFREILEEAGLFESGSIHNLLPTLKANAELGTELVDALVKIKDLESLVQQVKRMRELQRRYFRERRQDVMLEAKHVEREVDQAIEALARTEQQAELFTEEVSK